MQAPRRHSSILQRLAPMALLCSLAFLAACVQMPDLDARFEAGWRPSRGYCAFGGETARLAAWCADVNFGREGLMVLAREVNRDVLARASGTRLPCTVHVADARRRMASYPDYVLTELYSCDAQPAYEGGRPVCHVSLLVTSLTGTRVVLDNGHVLDPATTGGVAAYTEFVAQVDRHWLEEPAVAAVGIGTAK